MAGTRSAGRIAAAALLLPLAASSGEPTTGARQLKLASPSSGGIALAGGLRLESSIGQPLASRSHGPGLQAATGFWTTTALPRDPLFADGFEETTP